MQSGKCANCDNPRIQSKFRCAYCRECKRKYDREYYRKTPHRRPRMRQLDKERNAKLRDFIAKYLLVHPCVDCGEKDILVLDFDHIDPKNKLERVSQLLALACGIAKLQEEIDKCAVRCANCHRRRTARQMKSYRLNY